MLNKVAIVLQYIELKNSDLHPNSFSFALENLIGNHENYITYNGIQMVNYIIRDGINFRYRVLNDIGINTSEFYP